MKKIFTILFLLSIHWGVFSQTVLTLDEYKKKVIDYNQNIKIATESVKAVQEAAKEIKTEYYPNVNGIGSYQYNFNPMTLNLGQFEATLKSQDWKVGANVNQDIYTGGRLNATYKSAQIKKEIAGLNEESVLDNISYTAEETYWNTVGSNAFLDAAKKYLGIIQNLHEIVQVRFDDGYISKNDLLKVETDLKQAEYQLSRMEQNYVKSLVMMNILMGENATNRIQPADSIQVSAIIPNIATVDEVLQNHPEYQLKDKEIELQKQQKNIDKSEFLPKVAIGAELTYGTPLINLTGDQIVSPIVFAQLNVPIFYWGKSKHSSNKNDALIFSKSLEKDLEKDRILENYNTSLVDMSETSKQIKLAKTNLQTASESLDLSTFSYEQGKLSIVDVQSSQVAWMQAYTNLITAYLNNKMSIVEYKKAVSYE